MCIEELKTNLEKIALQKSTPYCYLCQADAPTNVCRFCHSDDLARRSEGGVEFGIDHVVKELIEEHLAPIDCEGYFEASMQDCYSDEVKVGWLTLNTIDVIRTMDSVSWNLAKWEYFDSLEEDGQVISFDNGFSYYWTHEVEQFVEANLEEEGAA